MSILQLITRGTILPFLLLILYSSNTFGASTKEAVRLYKAGLSAIHKSDCHQAIQYFNKAIRIIPKDNRRLRGFGRTTIKYYPNAKIKQLKKTCTQVATQIRKTPPIVPKKPPVLSIKPKKIALAIQLEKDNIRTEKNQVLIRGSIRGSKKSRLTIDGTKISTQNNRFSVQMEVPVGYSKLTLKLTDGHSSVSRYVKVRRKHIIPLTLSILSPKKSQITTLNKQYRIKVKATGSPQLKVLINGQKTVRQGTTFSRLITLSNGLNTLRIVAKDKNQKKQYIQKIIREPKLILNLKNKTVLNIAGQARIQGKVLGGINPKLWIGTKKISLKKGQFDKLIQLTKGQNKILIKAVSGIQTETKTILVKADPHPLSLKSITPDDGLQTRKEMQLISGALSGGQNPILKITGKKIKQTNGKFQYPASLKYGKNQFKITATDATGRYIQESLTIERLKPLKIIVAQGDYITSKTKFVHINGRIEGLSKTTILTIEGKPVIYQNEGTFKYRLASFPTERKVTILVKEGKTKVEKIIRVVRE